METLTAVFAPGDPLKAGVGMNIKTNPLEDSPRLCNEAALARGKSVKTHVPDEKIVPTQMKTFPKLN